MCRGTEPNNAVVDENGFQEMKSQGQQSAEPPVSVWTKIGWRSVCQASVAC